MRLIKEIVRKNIPNFIILIISILLSFFIIEFSLRIFAGNLMSEGSIYEFDKDGWVWKPRPNSEISFVNPDNEEEYIKINSKGLRDYEYSYEKPNDVYRIIMLGDSMTAGFEVPLEDTFENILEKKLNEEDKKFEVINFGVRMYGTQEEFLMLETEGLKYNPNLVILNFYVGNDFLENARSSIFVLKNGTLIKNPEIVPIKFHSLRGFLSKNSFLYNLASKIIHNRREGERALNEYIEILKSESERTIDFKPNITYSLIKEMNDFLKKKNIDLIIVIHPTKEQVDNDKLEELLKEYNKTNGGLDLNWSINKIKNIGEIEDILTIDLLPEMMKRNNNSFYFDANIHYTKGGHNIIGEMIYNELINKEIVKFQKIDK